MTIGVRTTRYGIKRPPKYLVHAYVGAKHFGVSNLQNIHTGEKILINSDRYPSVARYQRNDLKKSLNDLSLIISAAVKKHAVHMNEQGAGILINALRPTFLKSQVYCPKDTGALVGTGELTVVNRSSGKTAGVTTVEMAYGRTGRVWYAAFVHEIRKYAHAAPTRYKFLESAIKEDLDKIPDRIADEAKKAAGTGT